MTEFSDNEVGLHQLIKEGIEEDLHLEYKSGDALINTEGSKKEISKDVSAFANSDGGVIIYGIKEFDEKEKRNPRKDRNAISLKFLAFVQGGLR